MTFLRGLLKMGSCSRCFSSRPPLCNYENNFGNSGRNGNNVANNFKALMNNFQFDKLKASSKIMADNEVPYEADIVIVGGGAVGLSAAYWMKQLSPNGYTVALVERDPTYVNSATVLSVSGLKQQFGLKEYIKMSMFSAEFYRKIKEHLTIPGVEPPKIFFNHQGFLTLATADGVSQLEQNYELQSSMGVKLEKLNKNDLIERFPWMNFSDIEMGCYGLENEGSFDPWFLLASYKTKAASLGVKFITGEVVGFTFEDITGYSVVTREPEKRKRLRGMQVKRPDGETQVLNFALCVNCGGPWAGEIARMAGIGAAKEGSMSVELPVEPRKRFVYMLHCPSGPGLDTPVILDPSGVFIRREGFAGNYICGAPLPSKLESDDQITEQAFFESYVRPVLVNRVPAFENMEITRAWTGSYDFNYFDDTLFMGNHPYHRNFFMVAGLNGEGLQLSPAIGRAIMESMLLDDFITIDLSKMNFDRVLDGERIIDPSFLTKQ